MNWTAVICSTLLAGCSTVTPYIDRAAEANDAAVQSAEFVICYGASVGSIRRAYGSADRAQVWRDLCRQDNGFTPEDDLE